MEKYALTLILFIVIIAQLSCSEETIITPEPGASIPDNFDGTFDGEKITLHWTESELGTERGYEIWRYNDEKGAFELIGETDAGVFEFVDNDITGNRDYEYRARCVFREFEGEFTAAITVSTALPPPVFLSLSCDGSALIIDWHPGTGSAPNGYEVWRSVADNSNYQLLGKTASGETSYRDPDVVLDETYYYRVRALYGLGESGFSEEVYITIREYTYGGEWTIEGSQNGPYSIATAANGDIYVTEYDDGTVYHYDGTGGYLGEWTYSGWRYQGIAVSPNGNTVYLSDGEYDRVGMFTSNGVFTGYLGTGNSGSGDGDFNRPGEIAVAPNGNVYVADGWNHRVQYFTSTGQYLGQWGEYGSFNGQFGWPIGIDVASGGEVYVCEYEGNRVQYFSATGDFLGGWGSLGGGDGQFFYPMSVAVSPLNGDVFVSQWDRLQYFSGDGTFKGYIGVYGEYGGLVSSAGICLSPSGDRLYVCEELDRMVKYFVRFEG